MSKTIIRIVKSNNSKPHIYFVSGLFRWIMSLESYEGVSLKDIQYASYDHILSQLIIQTNKYMSKHELSFEWDIFPKQNVSNADMKRLVTTSHSIPTF